MDEKVTEEPQEDATAKEIADYDKRHNHLTEVTCMMLVTMVLKLKKIVFFFFF